MQSIRQDARSLEWAEWQDAKTKIDDCQVFFWNQSTNHINANSPHALRSGIAEGSIYQQIMNPRTPHVMAVVRMIDEAKTHWVDSVDRLATITIDHTVEDENSRSIHQQGPKMRCWVPKDQMNRLPSSHQPSLKEEHPRQGFATYLWLVVEDKLSQFNLIVITVIWVFSWCASVTILFSQSSLIATLQLSIVLTTAADITSNNSSIQQHTAQQVVQENPCIQLLTSQKCPIIAEKVLLCCQRKFFVKLPTLVDVMDLSKFQGTIIHIIYNALHWLLKYVKAYLRAIKEQQTTNFTCSHITVCCWSCCCCYNNTWGDQQH